MARHDASTGLRVVRSLTSQDRSDLTIVISADISSEISGNSDLISAEICGNNDLISAEISGNSDLISAEIVT